MSFYLFELYSFSLLFYLCLGYVALLSQTLQKSLDHSVAAIGTERQPPLYDVLVPRARISHSVAHQALFLI